MNIYIIPNRKKPEKDRENSILKSDLALLDKLTHKILQFSLSMVISGPKNLAVYDPPFLKIHKQNDI